MTPKTLFRNCMALSFAVLAVVACGDDDDSSTATTGAGATETASDATGAATESSAGGTESPADGTEPSDDTSAAGDDPVAAAQAATEIAFEGTNREVDPTSRPAATDKSIVIISAAQGSISSSVPVAGAEEAAKALGWDVTVYDAKGSPANYSPLIRQAIAAGADGIVLNSIDCRAAKEALLEAREAGVVIVAQYAFDCNDPLAGGEAESLFSTEINYGSAAENLGAFTEAYGADQANYIIAESDNTAKIIALQDSEFVVLLYTYAGFAEQIEASGGSEIVSTLDFTVADLLSGQLTTKLQAELLRHPEATWIKSPYTGATIGGVVPALGDNPTDIKVMGGEGFEPELDLAREGKVHAFNIISSEWTGWASIDAMNSTFLEEPTVDSGIGWTIVDADHGLPESGPFVPPVDFKAGFQEAWGVGG